jgi:RimJ/RimL family protein N-acetyltransferase
MSAVPRSSTGPRTEVVIETTRLRLRPHREDDLAALVALAGDWHVARWLSTMPHPYSDAHGRDWIAHVRQAHAAGRPLMFAIAIREADALIGGCGLNGSTGDGSPESSLGYWLGQPYWGRGYAREAVAAIIDYGFRELGLPRIRALTDPGNTASQKVLLACGLRKAGDIDLIAPTRLGAARAPLFLMERPNSPAP